MYFEDFQSLLFMEGHGVFVWSVYGLALIIVAIILITPLRRKRRFLLEQRMRLRREQAQHQHIEQE